MRIVFNIKKSHWLIFLLISTLLSCEKNQFQNINATSYNINSLKLAPPNVEDLILTNAQKTLQLRLEYLEKGEKLLKKIDTKNLNNNYTFSLLNNNLSLEDSILLADSLKLLVDEFNNLKPKPIERIFDEDKLPATLTETPEFVLLGGDGIIDKAIPENARLLSNLIRISKGMDPILDPVADNDTNNIIISSLNKVNINFGFNTSYTKLWPGGNIYYFFNSNVADYERNFIKSMMNEWTNKTSNKVRFIEYPSTSRTEYLYSLGLTIVKINKKYDLAPGVSGNANVGSANKGTINIASIFITDRQTVLHELGHTIGLQHEHQRPDRDSYVRTDNTGPNFDKIEDKYAWFLWWSWKISSHAKTSIYDYQSIMHYTNVFYNYNSAGVKTFLTTGGVNITNLDANMVKQLYSNSN